MTNESLQEYINQYNSRSWVQPYSDYRLSRYVVLAKIWSNKEHRGVANIESDTFYFVENYNGTAVAIVFLMGISDIHWFVNEDHRGKGYLHKALQSVILPHIFLDGRKEQRASYDSEKNKTYLIRQGFEPSTPSNENICILRSENVHRFDESEILRVELSEADVNDMQNELYLAARRIRQVRDKINCAYGLQNDDLMECVARNVSDIGLDLMFIINEIKEEQCKSSRV